MQLRSGSRRLISTLLRAGARLPAADTSYRRSSPAIAYIDAIRRAGGYARYETMRRAPFITALTRCGGFPIPDDMISIVVGFWVRRALEYSDDRHHPPKGQASADSSDSSSSDDDD